MSLRGFFSRNTDSHRRRKSSSKSTGLATQAEFLEDRILLSVESPFLNNHGVTFRNTNVLGRADLTFFPVDNPLYSGNTSGQGLNVLLDGSALDGNLVSQLRTVTLNNLNFVGNGNAGASLNFSNMVLDEIRIDSSVFFGNQRAGLVINLNNVIVDRIIITNNSFSNNSNDGLCLLGTNSTVNNITMQRNFVLNNQINDGTLFRFSNSLLGNVFVGNNNFNNNGFNGFRADLTNTTTANLFLLENLADTNAFNAAVLNLTDSDVRGSAIGNTFINSQIGDGLSVTTRRSLLPTGQVSGGLRNLTLERIFGNNFSGNAGTGLNLDLGQNTTFKSAITTNIINNNSRVGLNLQARDTQNAFDVTIGGDALDNQNNPLDANTFDGNTGAGVAITLDDTSNVLGNTTGRFQILNNTITNTLDDLLPLTEFSGEGLFVRARGNVSLANGAARILNSRIDGNRIINNGGHGMMFDISEDSEVIDLLIGDLFDPTNFREAPEGDGAFLQNLFVRNTGNIVQGNLGSGLNFLRRDAAVARNVRVIDNLFDGNVGGGVTYTVRNDDNVLSTLFLQHNDLTGNGVGGLVLSTEIDASLVADLDNNLIGGNTGDGILTLGFKGDDSDAETFGGTWTRNIVEGNTGKGININGVPGTVSPLNIGLAGVDFAGRSLGNVIRLNGDDGVEINAPGVVNIQNNLITQNGQNNTTLNVHGDGKGIDINLNDVILDTSGDFFSVITGNVIERNLGDGLEILARSDEFTSITVQVTAYQNTFDLNLGRGVDVLNAGTAESYILFGDGTRGTGSQQNNIRSNGLEGFYAVNTTSTNQRQDVNASAALLADTSLATFTLDRAPNLTLDVNGNEIRQNGLPQNLGQLNGSGLVIRVGTSGAIFGDESEASDIPDYDGVDLPDFNDSRFNSVGNSNSAAVGNGRVNARVNNNTFGGNRGTDVITESFVSTLAPPATTGTWSGTVYDILTYTTDPLARFNFEFTNNSGQAVDLVRFGASYNNAEAVFKSRTGGRTAPDPDGPFGVSSGRERTAQRLPGRGEPFENPNFGFGGLFSGLGGGASGTLDFITQGSENTPIVVTASAPHGLSTGDVVLLEANGFGTTGFTLDNLFEIIDIDGVSFALANTEGETFIDEFFPGMDFTEVTNGRAMLYPGIGPSTFRIIEASNSFPQGNDFSPFGEDAIRFAAGGQGHRTFTFDREEEGTFNFRTVSVANAQASEGSQLAFVITLSEALSTDLDVFYRTEFSGSASDGVSSPLAADFTPVNDFATILAGETQVTVLIDTIEDSTFEGSEFFKFIIDSAESTVIDPFDPFNSFTENFATPIGGNAIGTIVGDDPFPQISISDAGGFEQGNGGVGTMTFNVTLSNASANPIFVDFATADFTANVDVDYRFRSGTLTFAPGETLQTITIEILSDDIFSTPSIDLDSETLFVNLSAAQGANIFNSQGLGTIFDARFVSINDTFANGEGDAPNTSLARFDITLTDRNGNASFVPAGQTLTVLFTTLDGQTPASPGSDYVSQTGPIVFNEFESTKPLFITVNQDRVTEGDEVFAVFIDSQQGTIQDNVGIGRILEPLDIVSTRDASGQSRVRVVDTLSNRERFSFNPYPGYFGDARIATGDFNNDGIMDIVTAVGQNGRPHVKIFNGANGALIRDFFAYDQSSYFAGVWIAVGDINNDGFDDIITGPDVTPANGLPQQNVRVFDGVTGLLIEDFLALGLGATFTGGIRVAAGNVDGLGGDDIVLGYGPGDVANPAHVALVEVYVSDGNPIIPPTLFRSFEAYARPFKGGVYVATADIGGGAGNTPDGKADIITGAGAGGGPHVKVFNGDTLAVMESFLAYDQNFLGGVRVSAGDIVAAGGPTRIGVSEILTAPGPSGGPVVLGFVADGIAATPPPQVLQQFVFPNTTFFGTYIAGRDKGRALDGSPLALDPSALPNGLPAPELTQAQLAPVVEAAFSRLSAAGVSAANLATLRNIDIVLTDLDGTLLGLQTPGRIYLDRTAAGRGYFVDLTPHDDEEFLNENGRLIARDPQAQGRVDLLSVLLHELGHALGEDHVDIALDPHDLFAPTILPGERRLPEFDHVFSSGELFESLLDLPKVWTRF